MISQFHHPEFIKQAYTDAYRMRHRVHSELLKARIFLEAICQTNDINRFFYIFTAPTLAKNIWAIKVINGRIGCKGTTRHYHFDNPRDLQTKLRLILRKRLNATRRLGCNYRIIETSLSHHIISEMTAPLRKKTQTRINAKDLQNRLRTDLSLIVSKKKESDPTQKEKHKLLSPSLTEHASYFSFRSTNLESRSAPLPVSKITSESELVPQSTSQETPTTLTESSQFVPSSSQSYLWQSCVPTQSMPETRLRRETDPEIRQQKLKDTLEALNKKMGKDTVVVATSPLKSHWMTK